MKVGCWPVQEKITEFLVSGSKTRKSYHLKACNLHFLYWSREICRIKKVYVCSCLTIMKITVQNILCNVLELRTTIQFPAHQNQVFQFLLINEQVRLPNQD
jgi:hypothetical protein